MDYLMLTWLISYYLFPIIYYLYMPQTLFTVLLAADDAYASAVIRLPCDAVYLAISDRRGDGLDASSIKFLHVLEACIFIVCLVACRNVALLLVERLQSTASELRKLAEIAGILRIGAEVEGILLQLLYRSWEVECHSLCRLATALLDSLKRCAGTEIEHKIVAFSLRAVLGEIEEGTIAYGLEGRAAFEIEGGALITLGESTLTDAFQGRASFEIDGLCARLFEAVFPYGLEICVAREVYFCDFIAKFEGIALDSLKI